MAKTKIDYSNLTPDEILYLKAKDAYYNGMPIMNDETFDLLEDKLKDEDSYVIDIVGSKKNKVDTKHISPMLSLSKIKFKKDLVPYQEFLSFFKSINSLIEFGPKLDGNAINIVYENGKLISIASRGDGKMGQNYTKQLGNKVPQTIKDFTGEIRGEAVIDLELFNQKYASVYKNARNFVAGILSSDFDTKMVSTYNDIDFIAFDVKSFDMSNNKLSINQWLASKGFDVLDYIKTYNYKDIDETTFIQIFNEFVNYRKTSKYQLDGYVAKVLDNTIKEELGQTNHHPNWALAIKFVAEEVYTKVIDIEWNMSKRGELCPVAILEPVELMGSTVQRASVFNASWMLSKKCYPGAVVKLVKSGDIIPTIIDIIEEAPGTFDFPIEHNGNKLTYNGVHLLVDGFEDTKEYKAIQMYHTISTLGFKNIGPATCELLSSVNITINDILNQNPQGLEMLLINSGAFKRGRELELLIENLFTLNELELSQVIQSFGWRNCGKTISNQLANYVAGIDYDFKGLEKSVVEGFINSIDKQNQVKELVSLLESNNIKVNKPKSLDGLILFEMTGSPEPYGYRTKEVFLYEMKQLGATKSSLKKGTHFLVTDSLSSNSSKMDKARKLDIPIIEYDKFHQYLIELEEKTKI